MLNFEDVKIGDKLLVSKDLVEDEVVNGEYVNDEMAEQAGKVVTVYDKMICPDAGVEIVKVEESKHWHWTAEMFAEKV